MTGRSATGAVLVLGIAGDLQDVWEAPGKSAARCQGEQPEEVEMCHAMAAGAPHLKE